MSGDDTKEDTEMARVQNIKEDRQQKKCPLIEPG